MKSDERLKLIKRSHAAKLARQPLPRSASGEVKLTPVQVAATLARLDALQNANARAQMARLIAEFEAFAKAHPPGSLKRPPCANAGGA